MVVVLSGAALVLFLLLAFFVLRATASDLLPGGASPANPHSLLRIAEPPARAA